MAGRKKSRGPAGPELAEDEVCIGRVMAPFGLRGEVKLFLYNPASTLLSAPRDAVLWWAGGRRRRVRLSTRPGAGKRILGRVEGVSDPQGAAELVDAWVILPKSVLPELDAETWYHHELLGLAVVTDAGRSLGRIREIHESGPFDMWVVRGPEGEVWVPFREGAVLEVRPGEEAVVAEAAVLDLGQ